MPCHVPNTSRPFLYGQDNDVPMSIDRKCASELPSPCRNLTSGTSARSALVRSEVTSGSAFSFTEIAHVVCGVTMVQIPSPSVSSPSARCTSSVMMRICSRAVVVTVNVFSSTPTSCGDSFTLPLLRLDRNPHRVERAVDEDDRNEQ